jgi:hypothetical protein
MLTEITRGSHFQLQAAQLVAKGRVVFTALIPQLGKHIIQEGVILHLW